MTLQTPTSVNASRPFTAVFFLTLFGRLVYERHAALAGHTQYSLIPMLAEVQGRALPATIPLSLRPAIDHIRQHLDQVAGF